MNQIFERLSKLQGSWKGRGTGKFPTIDSFEYEEHLEFEVNLAYPLIHYEQKTILLPNQEPSHWESGFIRVLDEGLIELANSQDSGRVEVLQGKMIDLSEDECEIDLVSIALANDPRMVKTRRVFKLTENTLEYEQSMATTTTDEAIILPHLYATLSKVN